MPTVVKPPKHILVNGKKIRHRFIQSLLWTVIVTQLCVAAWAALYYLGTQKGIFFAKSSWDGLFSYSWWPNYRHGLRDVGEPVLAAMSVHSLIVSSWKKHQDKVLTGLELVFRVVMAAVTAFGIIILGTYVIDYVVPQNLTQTVNSGVAGNVLSGFNWEAFVFSFIAVHLIRSLWAPVGNMISLTFTESAVARAKGRLPLWVKYPLSAPAMRERFVWVQQTTPDVKPGRDIATRVVMVLTVVMFLLAVYGEYVLHVIARAH